MKYKILSLILASTMLASAPSANAGVGLSALAITCLAQGGILAGAIFGGLGAGSIVHGARSISRGRIGWGVFFLILKENGSLSAQDAEILGKLDVATQEAILDISLSDDAEEVKTEKLNALLN